MASSLMATTVTKILTANASSTSASSTKVVPQGGVLEGVNPVVYSPSNPIILFIIQAGIILMYGTLSLHSSRNRSSNSVWLTIWLISMEASAVSSTIHFPSFASLAS